MNPKYNSHIAYLILTDNSQQKSSFNHYYNEHIKHRQILGQIISLPKNIAEIYTSKEKLINMRMIGIIDGYYIRYVNDINEIQNYSIKTKFIVVSNNNEVERIYKTLVGIQFTLLSDILPTDERLNLYNFKDLSIEKFQTIFEDILKKQDQTMQNYYRELKKNTFNRNDSDLTIKTDIEINRDIYTLSNINTLHSIRVQLAIKNKNYSSENTEQSIGLINHIKSKIFHNLKTYEFKEANHMYDYVISDLSKNLDFQINKKAYTTLMLKDKLEDYEDFIKVLRFLKQYNFTEKAIDENKFIQEYIAEREYIEQLLSVLSSSYLAPNIKIPTKENDYISLLKEIGTVDRNKSSKIHNSFAKLEKSFSKDIADSIDYMKCKSSYRLKLVSNLPLEWINHCELPLMIKNEVSRIPVSPGYLTEKLLLDTEQIHLSSKAFENILFISSFDENDPIKNDVKHRVEFIQKRLSKSLEKEFIGNLVNSNVHTKGMSIEDDGNKIDINIEWKNVANQNELIEVLNNNSSAIAIFDMHGGHLENGEGFLVLQNETINISSLLGKIKIPPIVILSACDTNPIDNNHYSVANMFLLAGAKTVLASALPIMSKQASVYIARLLIRMSIFLYIHLFKHGKSIRWSTFISGMTKQSYYTELIYKLQDCKIISEKQNQEVNFFVNMTLNPLQLDFHNKILDEISNKSNLTKKQLHDFIENNHNFAECLKYIQLGNPENIIIMP
jgi:hypothetical protein